MKKTLQNRVLILAPTAKDAGATARFLDSNGINAYVCTDIPEICDELKRGVAAIILTQEALLSDRAECLHKSLLEQPPWSDIPLLTLTLAGVNSISTLERLESIGHMTLIPRPVQITELMSAVRAAMRDRTRQYKLRDYLKKMNEQARELKETTALANSANQSKTEFLANVSHEIRTPMNAIIGLSEILERTSALDEKQRKIVETLRTSADSLLTLINDLLDISKIESNNLQIEQIPFNLRQITDEIARMMSVQILEKGLKFETEWLINGNRNFIGDPTRIRQVLVNLCSNAVKFTESGSIVLKASADENVEPAMVRISISDTGSGIPEDKLETIFEKFTQADSSISRKYGGTGLGLAITRKLVNLMGGDIAVKSKIGHGSTFTVSLPLQPSYKKISDDSEAPLDDSLEKQGNKSKKRILLVEDHATNVMVAGSYLDLFGYDYDVADNGAVALEKIRKNRYAAILMDVQMPEMNGIEATEAIREYERRQNSESIPIIGMTAHALVQDRQKCLKAGMNDYLSKPFNPKDLQRILTERVAHQHSP